VMRLQKSLELSHPKAFFCVMALCFSILYTHDGPRIRE